MTEQNTLSISELQQQANAEDAQAQLELAGCYLKGVAVEKDKELALIWMKKAAAQGHRGAQCNLILLYPNEVIEEDVELALEYLTHVEDSINSQEFQEAHDENYLKDERKKVSAIFWEISRRFCFYAERQDLSKCLDLLIKSFEYCPKDVNCEFYLSLTASICGLMQEASLTHNQQIALINKLAGEQQPDDYINCMVNAFLGYETDEYRHGDKYEGFLMAAKLYMTFIHVEGWNKEDYVHNPISGGMVPRNLKNIPPTAQYSKENFEDVLALYIADKKFDSAESYLESVFKNKSEASTTEISSMDHDSAKKYFQAIWKNFEDKEKSKRLWLTYIKQAKELDKKNQELDEKNKQLQEKEKGLEDMMSMFTHKFRSPLDAIIYNTSHDNNPKLHAEAAQTMRGLLDIFSIISTDDKILTEKIKADCQGNVRLMTVLSKNLNMILLHLLSASGTEKIHQHYLAYAKAHGKIAASVTYKEWYDEHFELEQVLQTEWEQRFSVLLTESASLAERLSWLEQHFFKLELIGFDRDDIQFKEYGVTESFLTILLNEIMVNAFKYYASETRQAVVLEWSEQDGKQILRCRNPSIHRERSVRKGSGKGHTFLSALARKIGCPFTKPKPQDDFVLEFAIPNELLISGK